MDCNLPDSSIHGILHARILEWVAISSSKGSSPPRDWTRVSCGSWTAGGFFTTEPPGKPSEVQGKVKRMKKTEDSLSNVWDNIKHKNIRIIEVPEEEKKKGYEKNFEEIIAEIFSNMEKEIVNQVQ